jgi:hypothetical protein
VHSPANVSRSSAWKWSITGLLLLATTINYMDRVTLGSASVRVTQELGLDDRQYGNLELVFGWAFAAGSLVFGFLADHEMAGYGSARLVAHDFHRGGRSRAGMGAPVARLLASA